eukprot:1318590-Rhodomonas_salina.2
MATFRGLSFSAKRMRSAPTEAYRSGEAESIVLATPLEGQPSATDGGHTQAPAALFFHCSSSRSDSAGKGKQVQAN